MTSDDNSNQPMTKDEVKRQFLLLLLTEIEKNGNSIKTIGKNLKFTKQRLNYYLNKRLKGLGIVKKLQSFPFAIYELTDFGLQVKKILEHSQDVSYLWKLHNGIVGFQITDWGNFYFGETSRRKLIPMNNWKYLKEDIGEYSVNIQENGLLKIYVPERFTGFPDAEMGNEISRCGEIAQQYCDKFNMKMEKLKIVREFEKELVGSEMLARAIGRVKTDELFINASKGIMRMEEKVHSHKIEDVFIDLPKRMERIEEMTMKFAQSMELYNKNIELHLSAIQGINDGIKELRDAVKELRKK